MMKNPETGLVKNGAHIFPVRVYFEDTDSGGIVYYANYLKYAERARTEFLRFMGYSHATMMSDYSLALVVRRCEVDYFKSAYLDDVLTVRSGNVEIKSASLLIEQTITRELDEIANILVRLACIGETGKPMRLPNEFCDALLPLLAFRT
jgi:acyl-CoA thioester hydrolase